jgi:hypothetical protein
MRFLDHTQQTGSISRWIAGAKCLAEITGEYRAACGERRFGPEDLSAVQFAHVCAALFFLAAPHVTGEPAELRPMNVKAVGRATHRLACGSTVEVLL